MRTIAERLIARSGAPAFSPLALAPYAWYDASQLALTDGDPVATWPDLSGNGRHLTQPTSAARPTFKTGILNGHPVVRFDGIDDFIQSAALALAQPLTLFIVLSTNVIDRLFLYGDSAQWVGYADVASLGNAFALFAGTAYVAKATTLTAFHANVCVVNGASSKTYVDGGSPGTGDAGANALGVLTLGASNGGSSALDGDIAEFLLYGALTLANLNLIGNYLATKWGTVWTVAT